MSGTNCSPLGDPPLFVGFLRGVDFFWTTRTIWLQTAIVAGLLLIVFAGIDWWRFRAELHAEAAKLKDPVRIRGLINIVLIAAVVAIMLVSATWKPGLSLDVVGTRSSFRTSSGMWFSS